MKVKVLNRTKDIGMYEQSKPLYAAISTGLVNIPDMQRKIMYDLCYGWYKIGNEWVNTLEAELKADKQEIENIESLNNFNAADCLVFLGYMEKRKWSAANRISNCTQYRLTQKGKDVAKNILHLRGEKEEEKVIVNSEEVDCPFCEGSGVDDTTGNVCSRCRGMGVKSTVVGTVGRKSKSSLAADKDEEETQRFGRIAGVQVFPPEKAAPSKKVQINKKELENENEKIHKSIGRLASRTPLELIPSYRNIVPQKRVTKPTKNVACYKCAGTGMVRKNICSLCDGTGEKLSRNDLQEIQRTTPKLNTQVRRK